MASGLVARRYAQALLEIGIAHDKLDVFRAQLNDLARLLGEVKIVQTVLLNPSIRLSERRDVVRSLAQKRGWDAFITNFAMLLLDNDRVRHAGEIANQFGQLLDRHLGNVRAQVTSATELSASQKAQLEKALGALTGKTVLLETATDPALLGGAVTRIGSTVYDGSVKRQIARLRESILAGV